MLSKNSQTKNKIMDMFFFKEISGLIPEGTELTVTIKRVGNEMIVSVLPRVKDLKDEAAKKLVPLVVSGTPDELDKGFSAASIESHTRGNRIACQYEGFREVSR